MGSPSPSPDARKVHYGSSPDARVRRMFDILSRSITPQSDLEYDGPFQLLLAVVLSAQATDSSVNRATRTLFAQANSPQEIIALGVAGVIPHIRHIGLYNAKAKHLVALCQALLERHHGQVPNTRAALQALPGVGRKTASVVLNIAFGQPEIAVDTHVHRVANRLGMSATTKVDHTEQVLCTRTPQKHRLHAHHYLILHGRYTCTARKPACSTCPLAHLCPSRQEYMAT
ncbi:MAG: endonuclease III [Planctomycetota bacterium]|nr:MAG: endonuclease III [Planctomycetota bacterium]